MPAASLFSCRNDVLFASPVRQSSHTQSNDCDWLGTPVSPCHTLSVVWLVPWRLYGLAFVISCVLSERLARHSGHCAVMSSSFSGSNSHGNGLPVLVSKNLGPASCQWKQCSYTATYSDFGGMIWTM